jgi:hypothetical protein
MSLHSIFLGSIAVVAFLGMGTQPGRADPDTDGMDHSKLNHGVLGRAAQRDTQGSQASGAIVWANPVSVALANPVGQSDPNVAGTDHSKLNHGVLGSAGRP